MMRKIQFLILLVVNFFIFISCEEEIELNIPNQTPKIVVHGLLSPDNNKLRFYVSKSVPVTQNSNDIRGSLFVENLDLKLYGNNQLIGSFIQDTSNSGLFNLNYLNILEGEKYTLIGNSNGYTPIKAEVIIPNKPNCYVSNFIYSKKANYDSIHNFQNFDINFCININDSPNEDNYYEISIYKKLDHYGYPIYFSLAERNDPSIKLINNCIYNISDKLFNGTVKTIAINYTSYYASISATHVADTFWVQCKSITKEYYDYTLITQKQIFKGKDFFSEPMLINTNIIGGCGMIGAYNLVRKELVVHYIP